MPKFTTPENLYFQIDKQSVGPYTEGNEANEILRVFQPEQGIDVLYRNPLTNNDSTEIIEDRDSRIKLGTFTLNNRGFWEDINFNEATFSPYLSDGRGVVETEIIEDGNGEKIVKRDPGTTSSTYRYSIDALPFVTNPNDGDEIIRVDRYWDKKINSTEHYLATEGKINYYIYPRTDGRLESGNIDLFSQRNRKDSSLNKFTSYSSNEETESGFYLFKLNWGDGSPLEHTTKPKLLEGTTLLDHIYEKPGFYTISGVVYVSYSGKTVDMYERFETNILLNESRINEFNLYEYENFATIGGISDKSTLVKSIYNTIGFNPLTGDSSKANLELIKGLNDFDKLKLLNFVYKISSEDVVEKFNDLIQPYSMEILDQTETEIEGATAETLIEDQAILGCMDPNADNYNSEADEDDGSCSYSISVVTQVASDGEALGLTIGEPGVIRGIRGNLTTVIPPGYNADGTSIEPDIVGGSFGGGNVDPETFDEYTIEIIDGGPAQIEAGTDSNTNGYPIINPTNRLNGIDTWVLLDVSVNQPDDAGNFYGWVIPDNIEYAVADFSFINNPDGEGTVGEWNEGPFNPTLDTDPNTPPFGGINATEQIAIRLKEPVGVPGPDNYQNLNIYGIWVEPGVSSGNTRP